jgi:abhydrolase domain-containing protein 6
MSSYSVFFVASLFLFAALGVAIWIWRRQYPAEPTFGLATNSVSVNKFEIRYHKSGRGPFLVLLHGIGADLQCWQRLVPLLKKDFTVIALDLPGFGQSSKIRGERYGLDDQTKRLNDFLGALDIREAYVVGNSMGGNLALWLAIQREERVKGVVVIAPPSHVLPMSFRHWTWVAKPASYLVARPALRWLHERTVSRRELVSRERVEETLKTYGRNPDAIASFLSATETLSDPRLARRLNEIEQPVLVLWGSRDKLVTRKMIDSVKAALPQAETEVHLGGGHHLQEDEPEWVADKIRTFFKT